MKLRNFTALILFVLFSGILFACNTKKEDVKKADATKTENVSSNEAKAAPAPTPETPQTERAPQDNTVQLAQTAPQSEAPEKQEKITYENYGDLQSVKPIVIKAYDMGYKYLVSEDCKNMVDRLAEDQMMDVKEKLHNKVAIEKIMQEARDVLTDYIARKDSKNAKECGFKTFKDYMLIQQALINDPEIVQWRDKIIEISKVRFAAFEEKIQSYLK